MNSQLRKLYYSDNLPVLREMESESVDLIYLDPPFNSNRSYNIIYPDALGQVRAFEDTWSWTPQCDEHISNMKSSGKTSLCAYDILNTFISAMGKVQINAYLVNMAVRLLEMKRILTANGTIYLHCDPTASHYLKVILDRVFGEENFRNEIIWYYRGAGTPQKDFARRHDVIFRYAKSPNLYFDADPARQEYAEATIQRFSHHIGNVRGNRDYGTQELNPLGKHPDDVFTDIQPIAPSAKDRLGYPTQKPFKLLERIVKVSSKKGDVVLDPFCGCGTTIAAAEVEKRQWIGIDITYSAIAAIQERFKRQKLDIWGDIEILGKPNTVKEVDEKLLNRSSPLYARKEFEKFCVATIGGLPNDNMGADGGIDGVIPLGDGKKAVVSVKSGRVSVSHIRELRGILDTEKVVGIFISREKPTKEMEKFANASGQYELKSLIHGKIPRIQILTLEDILNGIQPSLI